MAKLTLIDPKEYKNDYLTEDQMTCVKDGIDRIEKAHPGLSEWFEDCEQSAFNLLHQANDCEGETGLKKMWCSTQLKASALYFFAKYRESLPDDDKGIITELKDMTHGCMVDPHPQKKIHELKTPLTAANIAVAKSSDASSSDTGTSVASSSDASNSDANSSYASSSDVSSSGASSSDATCSVASS